MSLRGLRFRLLSARDASDEGISFGSFVGASEVDGGAGQSDVVRALSPDVNSSPSQQPRKEKTQQTEPYCIRAARARAPE